MGKKEGAAPEVPEGIAGELPQAAISREYWVRLGHEGVFSDYETAGINLTVAAYPGAHGPIVVLAPKPGRAPKYPIGWITPRYAAELSQQIGHPELLIFENDGGAWAMLVHVEDLRTGDMRFVRVRQGAEDLLRMALSGAPAEAVTRAAEQQLRAARPEVGLD